jgi:hypothetical protein
MKQCKICNPYRISLRSFQHRKSRYERAADDGAEEQPDREHRDGLLPAVAICFMTQSFDFTAQDFRAYQLTPETSLDPGESGEGRLRDQIAKE